MSHPHPPSTEPDAPAVGEQWLEEPEEELPRRPRRRLLTPAPLTLTAVLLIACGFIGGVLVEKGQSSSTAGSGSGAVGGFASRFAALRSAAGGSSATGAGPGAAAAGSGTSSGAAAGAGFTRPTAGTVAYLAGKSLYVTNSEGNTIKVTTSPATSVTKTVKSSVKGVHPGETVTIVGSSASNGTVSAESISVGSGGSALAGLFRRGGGSSGTAGSKSSGSGSGEPALFGSGG
jgi:hypothetical protein